MTNESSSVHESAADAVCALLERLEELPSDEGSGALELSLFTAVRRLEDSYHMAVATEDISKAVNFCRIFTEFAESLLLKITAHSAQQQQQPHFAVGIFDSVLLCCGHPDYDMPDITFNLWYRLSEELYHRDDEALTALFKPYVERLIVCLGRHCQMEPDAADLLEEGEDFDEFRKRTAELIKDVVFVVGSANVFRHMYGQVAGAGVACGADGLPSWEVAEAAFFVMAAVARNILPDDDEVAPRVVQLALGLQPTSHPAVRHAAFRLMAELAEWVDRHPECLDRVLDWIMGGLRDARLSQGAARVMQAVCTHCSRHVAAHADALLGIVERIDDFPLKPAAANSVVLGVARLVGQLQPAPGSEPLRKMVWMQVSPLEAILSDPSLIAPNEFPRQAKNTTKDPVVFLDRLATIFK